MTFNLNHILNVLQNAIDSDDIQCLAIFAESDLSKEEMGALQKKLKSILQNATLAFDEAYNINQFLRFIS